jgi:hypothetical protein
MKKVSDGMQLLIDKNKEWREGLKKSTKEFENPIKKIKRIFGFGGAKKGKVGEKKGKFTDFISGGFAGGVTDIFTKGTEKLTTKQPVQQTNIENKTINIGEQNIFTKEDKVANDEMAQQIFDQMDRRM